MALVKLGMPACSEERLTAEVPLMRDELRKLVREHPMTFVDFQRLVRCAEKHVGTEEADRGMRRMCAHMEWVLAEGGGNGLGDEPSDSEATDEDFC